MYKNDKKHGQGKLTFADGKASYDGMYNEDKMDGYGVFRFADGDVYEGQWKNDMKHGQGKYTGKNNETYVGEWKNNLQVMATLSPRDYVVVIDVTGHSSRHVDEASVLSSPHVKGHVVFEKVRGNQITRKLLKSLSGVHTHHNGIPIIQNSPLSPPNVPYTFETFDWCADAIAFEDETDAYRETQENTVFLGLQTCGGSVQQLSSSGDYNAGEVFCWKRDIEAVSLAIVDLANSFVQSYEALLEEGDHDSDK